MSGRLDAIWIKRGAHGPMDAAAAAEAVTGRGLAGNADQGGKRQVTILSREAWAAATADLGAAVDPSLRRANLLVSGIDLADSRGKVLGIGAVRIRIYGETRPCDLMDRQAAGLRAALDPDWRAGAFGEVVEGGPLAVGDAAAWV